MKLLPRIIVIVGPTASGKTGLAIALAKKFHGEVVSADSRLLYKGMDIGTAKPTARERRVVPHHLIDVVSPAKTLTLSDYKRKALAAIRGILKRGRLPIVVGGTGLYVRALVDNLEIPEVPPDPTFRRQWEKRPAERISRALKKKDPAYAARIGGNTRYAIRALEVMRATGHTMTELQTMGEPLFDALLLGLRPRFSVLESRISNRLRRMLKAGLVQEVRGLLQRHSERTPALSGIGYRELIPFLKGEVALETALEAVRLHTRQYAKRQLTWFKRDRRIRWKTTPKAAQIIAEKWLKSAKRAIRLKK